MIIIGAGGFAIELLEVLVSNKYGYSKENLFFFDNINRGLPKKIFGQYRIIKSIVEVENIFKTISREYCLGIGSPNNRELLNEKFENLNGELRSIISKNTSIGSFDTIISKGSTMMDGVRITNDVAIGKGALLNLNSTVGHNTKIGDFVELNPGVHVSGGCHIGNKTSIGTGAVVLPNVTIGKNVIIGAGSVIIREIPDNCTVAGVPGEIIKTTSIAYKRK